MCDTQNRTLEMRTAQEVSDLRSEDSQREPVGPKHGAHFRNSVYETLPTWALLPKHSTIF